MNEVKAIHDSDLFGIIIETGAGAAITTRLTNIPGAGSTLYFSKVPYAKDYSLMQYGNFERTVARDFVEAAAHVEWEKLNDDEKAKINFIMVASSQIQTKPGVITHVWFNLLDIISHTEIRLHYTFEKSPVVPDRHTINAKIGQLGTNILATMVEGISGIEERIAAIETEAILDAAYVADRISGAPVLALEKSKEDYFLVFGSKGPMRFEELMRLGDAFIVNKGSFNPVHHQHLSMMTEARKMAALAVPVFLISTYRYDKPHISWDELKSRIDSITSLGYHVVVCKEPFFYNTFKMLRQKAGKQKKFFFTVGTDTVNRIYKTDLEETVDAEHPDPSPYMARVKIEGMKRIWSEQFKFIVFERKDQPLVEEAAWYDSFLIMAEGYEDDGTSSTKIRSGEIENRI